MNIAWQSEFEARFRRIDKDSSGVVDSSEFYGATILQKTFFTLKVFAPNTDVFALLRSNLMSLFDGLTAQLDLSLSSLL